MPQRRERNRVVVALVTVLILVIGVYGPITLLAPLPHSTVSEVDLSSTSAPEGPTLPADGASGVTLSASDAPITSGSTEPVPMAATAKIVTALVVLDKQPLEAGRSGPNVPVTADDYSSYLKFVAEGTKAVPVITGDSWTEREALGAMLIASSNNHAEMVARWAYGSLDNYLDAADKWLDANGLSSTTVTDATGLSASSVSTGHDLAILAALAMKDPFLADTIGVGASKTTRGASFDNTISYRADEGVTGISRSYTDEAGVCLLFAYAVTVGETPTVIYGAIVGEPSYDDLDSDMDAFIASVPERLTEVSLVKKGAPVVTVKSAWGETVNGVADKSIATIGWGTATSESDVSTRTFITGRAGGSIGSLTVKAGETTQTSSIVLEKRLGDPGILWRLTHPFTMIPSFFKSL